MWVLLALGKEMTVHGTHKMSIFCDDTVYVYLEGKRNNKWSGKKENQYSLEKKNWDL